MILEKIKGMNSVKKLSAEELPILAEEIRSFLIDSLSRTGGHLSSNLGSVELTVALHRVLNFPEDKLIWDVGHQAYTHKILTGRIKGFENLRSYGGMSGFPKRSESPCDAFDTGHSSTSISAGLGYVRARELEHGSYTVVSVIGDGAMTGGMAYEAMNNAGELDKNFIIVLNDNEMSITKNVGGMSAYLGNLRTSSSYTGFKMGVSNTLKKIPKVGEGMVDALRRTKSSIKQFVIPGMLFENMGLTYLGPVDGHNIAQMTRVFQEAKRVEGPVLVHVLTQKGKGYTPAVRHPARFHGTAPFEIETGIPTGPAAKASYTDVFSTVMRKMGDRNEKVVAVTAAMSTGTGLKRFGNMFPERFFDVGIAEEHAVTFAAGLALGGMIPVVAVYSSFLQRAFDQLLQDICMQKVHVVFAVDRAGLVGSDGETHQGCFDLSYLSMMPNMTVMAPKNKWEFSDMIKYAVEAKEPIAVRYPRGEAYDGLEEFRAPIEKGKAEIIREGEGAALLAVGSMVKNAIEAADILREKGISVTVVNMRFVKPLDRECILQTAKNHRFLFTVEENVRTGGFGQQVRDVLAESKDDCKLEILAVPDVFVEHGSVGILQKSLKLDAQSIADNVLGALGKE